MFDISWSELLIIGVVALIAIGPKELPGVLRACGQWMGKIRRMASEFQGQFQEAMREAEMADIKKQVDDMTGSMSDYTNFDPMQTVQKEVDKMVGDPFAEKPASGAGAVNTASTDPGAVSPEAVPETAPSPVSSDTAIPKPEPKPGAAEPDLTVAAEAPQPQPKVGSG
jgi:sec-independent protein translocase protein TatB